MDSLPKAERKRLIKEYKLQEKHAKRAKVAAAEEYLRNQGIDSGGGDGGGGGVEREGKSGKKKKDKKKDKKRDR